MRFITGSVEITGNEWEGVPVTNGLLTSHLNP